MIEELTTASTFTKFAVLLGSFSNVPKQPSICLVSPSHVAANPRLVKEANALHAAGYAVHVVAGWFLPLLDTQDSEIYAQAPWGRSVVYYFTGPRVLLAKFLRNRARKQLAQGRRASFRRCARACNTSTFKLARAAAKTRSDLYIGHCLPGLPAAAIAAKVTGGRYSFDAEDFHSAETDYVQTDPALSTSTRTLESALLPGCAHLTAASPLIAQAYSETYNLQLPETVLNVFPLSEAPSTALPGAIAGRRPKIYWFSQTIGPGRGLEQFVRCLAQMRTICDLHLRGIPAVNFVDDLAKVANDCGFTGKIEYHGPAPASEMARLAAPFDLGLALEQNAPLNRDLCLTNKIFTYLLAGVPVALSPTRAQRAIADELGSAAVMIDPNDASTTAAELDAFFNDAERRARARAEAWRLAQTRFNWDLEQQRLLETVERVLPRSTQVTVTAGT